MNSGFLPLNGQLDAPPQPEWRKQLDAWRQLLAECSRKPSRKRVHGLRVATLRLQAKTAHWLKAYGTKSPAGRAAMRWNKQAEKLRRALSPVRETDVYLAKLNGLRGSVAEPEQGRSRLSRICLRQITALERKFAQRRKVAAKKLIAEIASRIERLNRGSKVMEGAFAHAVPEMTSSGASGLRELIAGLATEFPELNADSLHEYRKRIKTVRYLAEFSPVADAQTGRQVSALKRMQSAVGEWHDWQALARKAHRALRDHDKKGGIAELLETLAEESLQRALEICERTTAQLLKQDHDDGVSRPSPSQKIPVLRAEPQVEADQRRLA